MMEREAIRDTPWHVREAEDAVSELGTDPERGLSSDEAERRLERFGPNRIRSGEMMPWYRVLLHQFTDPLIYVLLIAAAVSLAFQEYTDVGVILAVVVINGTIGFVQEYRARRAIRSLAEMSAPRARVVREGEEREVDNEEVVPGDVVVLSSGGRVPADARLLKADDLEVDESALTGESETVTKQADPVEDEKAVPGDQLSVAFSGTSVTRGRGRGVVIRTGDDSELGRIAETTQEMEEVKTPIQEKMDSLGKTIGVAVLVLAGIVVGGGLLTGMDLGEVVTTAVALAVAAMPEALPVVLTVALAVGVRRMAKRNAIIRLLPAVETLGSTTVIGSDKTGTLTTNQMTVKVIWAGGQRYDVSGTGYDPEGEIRLAEGEDEEEIGEAARMALLAGLLANETERLPGAEDGGGDPTEIAVLVSAVKAGLDPAETRREHEQVDIIPFESERQFMATLNETPQGRCIFMKGAPEAVLRHCGSQLDAAGDEEELGEEAAREMSGRLADEGYRVLGMAFRCTDMEGFEGHDPGDELVFAGFQGMEDPVRPEAVDAVHAAEEAGIRVLMLTGDHARTASAIGAQLDLGGGGRAEEGRDLEERSEEELDRLVGEVDVYARVSPDHKLQLIERLKKQGHIVAVTGDGVNDAPALQAAHLGIAMGRAGTDVAREASDMILTDDNFASITSAVEEGRVIFANIRKVTYFLLSTAAAMVLTILTSVFAPWPLPFVAAQVLWINLVTNGLQDVALAFEKGEPGLLKERPRDPDEGVVNRFVLFRLAWVGVLIAAATTGVFQWMLRNGASLELARSVTMTQMVMFQFFHVWNCRSLHRSIFKIPVSANPFLAASMVAAVLAHIGVLHLPFMQFVFDTVPLSFEHWALVLALGTLVIITSEIDKVIIRRRRKAAAEQAPEAEERQRPDEEEAAAEEEEPEPEDGGEEKPAPAEAETEERQEEAGEPTPERDRAGRAREPEEEKVARDAKPEELEESEYRKEIETRKKPSRNGEEPDEDEDKDGDAR